MKIGNYNSWSRILSVMLVFTALALCVRTTVEPDIWWQIRTGEYIIENGVPTNDVFSYTYSEVRWINIKWLTEVIMAKLSALAGAESLFLLQMLVLLIILITYRYSYKFYPGFQGSKEIIPAFYLAALLLLFTVSYRLNARPEMISHAFTAILLFLYWRFKSDKKSKLILLAIPLQILWANMHEAYGVGIVILAIILIANIIENYLTKSKDRSGIAILSLTLLISFLSTAISPHGSSMWLRPINIFSQLGENQFTTELIPFSEREYWNIFSVMNLLLFAVGLKYVVTGNNYGISSETKKRKKSKKLFLASMNLSYLLLYLSFFYLSLKSYRNIPFFMIVGFPAYMYGISTLYGRVLREYRSINLVMVAILIAIFYLSIPTNFLYNSTPIKNKYGLGIDLDKVPHGAAEFVKSNNISGKSFTDFMVSSYLLWYLQPDYKTFIDLRDLDIFPAEFFKNNILIYSSPTTVVQGGMQIWDYIVKEDNYNYIVLNNKPNISPLQRHLVHNDDRYELVFADPVASVYLRTSVENAELLDQFSFSNGKDVFREYQQIETGTLSKTINKIFNPFHKQFEYKSLNKRDIYYTQYLNIEKPY